MNDPPHWQVERRSQGDLANLSVLLLSSPEALAVCDESGRIIVVNEQFCEIFAYREEELLGQSIELLVPSRFRDQHPQQRAEYFTDPQIRGMGRPAEVRGLRSDGNEVTIETRLRLIAGEFGPLAVASVRDVTPFRQLQTLQLRSVNLLERVAAGLPLADVMREVVAWVEDTHAAARCAVCALVPAQHRLDVLYGPRLTPAETRFLSSMAAEGADSPALPIQEAPVHPNMPNESVAIPRDSLNESKPLLQSQQIWTERLYGSQGDLLGVFSVFRSESAPPATTELATFATAARVAGVALQREALLQRLLDQEAQLRQSQKLEAVGTLAGGVAHEFNNLLQVILGYTACAQDSLPAGSPSQADLEQVLEAAQNARRLTRQLLNFGRSQPRPAFSVLSPASLVASVSALLNPLLGKCIQLMTFADEHAPEVYADAGQLQQVLLNLAINARDAMPDGGLLEFRVTPDRLSDEEAERLGMPAGDVVRFSVIDNGQGMPPDVLARIFDPFFSTKGAGKGTGLGLSVALGIVRQHRGAILVDSKPGRGSTFQVLLPSAAQWAPEATAESQGVLNENPVAWTDRAPPQTKLLIVEDEPAIRVLLMRLLAEAGYEVIAAAGADEALQVCRGQSGDLQLAVLDIALPKQSGVSFAAQLRSLHPNLPIVFLTGYNPADGEGEPALHLTGSVLVTKPVERPELLRAVRQALAGTA